MADTVQTNTNTNAPVQPTKAQANVTVNSDKNKDVDKIVTYDAMISYSLFFNIKKGVLHWVKNNQSIYVEQFKITPNVGVNTVKMIAEYPSEDMVTIFNDALNFAKEQLRKNIKSSVNQVPETDTQGQPQNTPPVNENVQQNTQVNKDEIEKRYTENKNFTLPDDTKNANIVKSDYNNPDDVKNFILQYADEIKQNGLQAVLDKYIATQYTMWDDSDRQTFKTGVGLAVDELHNKELEELNNPKPSQVNNTDTEEVNESDDIYQGRDPKTFINIWNVQNDAEILIFVKNLKIKRDFSYNANSTKSFNIILEPQDISLDIIGYVESKKTKIMINNNEIRPKSELGFLQHILPSIKIEILLDK